MEVVNVSTFLTDLLGPSIYHSSKKSVKLSVRGELEITSINNVYLEQRELKVKLLGRGFVWFDTGTPEVLTDAADFVASYQNRQGLYISCIEEIAYNRNFIDKEQLEKLVAPIQKTAYGQYLMELVNRK